MGTSADRGKEKTRKVLGSSSGRLGRDSGRLGRDSGLLELRPSPDSSQLGQDPDLSSVQPRLRTAPARPWLAFCGAFVRARSREAGKDCGGLKALRGLFPGGHLITRLNNTLFDKAEMQFFPELWGF